MEGLSLAVVRVAMVLECIRGGVVVELIVLGGTEDNPVVEELESVTKSTGFR